MAITVTHWSLDPTSCVTKMARLHLVVLAWLSTLTKSSRRRAVKIIYLLKLLVVYLTILCAANIMMTSLTKSRCMRLMINLTRHCMSLFRLATLYWMNLFRPATLHWMDPFRLATLYWMNLFRPATLHWMSPFRLATLYWMKPFRPAMPHWTLYPI